MNSELNPEFAMVAVHNIFYYKFFLSAREKPYDFSHEHEDRVLTGMIIERSEQLTEFNDEMILRKPI